MRAGDRTGTDAMAVKIIADNKSVSMSDEISRSIMARMDK